MAEDALKDKYSSMVQNQITVEGCYVEGSYTEESILATRNMETREDDVFLMTFPRTGTTWMQNVLAGFAYGPEKIKSCGVEEMNEIFPYLEICLYEGCAARAGKITLKPRFMKSHLNVQAATQEIFTKKRKAVVVVRNPKDAAISFFHFYKVEPTHKSFAVEKLDDYLDKYLAGKVNYGSWWEWTKGWIEASRKYDNVFLCHYEDLTENFVEEARRLSEFLGLEKSPEEIKQIHQATDKGSMKARYDSKGSESHFVRHGNKSSWEKEMPEKYSKMFDEKTKEFFGHEPDLMKKFL